MFEKWLPERLDTFKELKKPIVQSDFSRYGYMYHDGGIYADLDMDCLAPMDGLLDLYPKAGVLLAMMGKDITFNMAIPNAFMASVPKHPMWNMCMDMVRNRTKVAKVEDVAGPTCLQDCLAKWVGYDLWHSDEQTGYLRCDTAHCKAAAPIVLLDNSKIFPVNWRKGGSKALNLTRSETRKTVTLLFCEGTAEYDTSPAQEECLQFCEQCTDMTHSKASVHFGEPKCLQQHVKCFGKLRRSGAFASTCWTKSWE